MKRRILFVDDEKRVLDGLRRMLRNMRHEWDMAFAESGAQALAMMDQQGVDVVVSDMRMPQMDGATLLKQVKDLHPGAVRIVLSGYAEREMVMKAFTAAHQYLTKPTDADTLKNVIGRACALRDMLAGDALQQLVSRTDSLPSVPVAYTRIMELMEQPGASARQIGRVVAEDLAMTAKVLQMVNSAFFGLPKRFSDVVQAVVYIGSETIRSLVLTCGLFSHLSDNIDGEALFYHSQQVSGIAKRIAVVEKMDKAATDDVLMAGLLHDVGKLIIADQFPDDFVEIANQAKTTGRPMHEVEYALLGASHAEVGAYLMGLWGLSDTVVEAIAYHHQPANCAVAAFDPLRVVHVADAFAHELQNIEVGNADVDLMDHALMEQLELADRLDVWRQAACRKEEER